MFISAKFILFLILIYRRIVKPYFHLKILELERDVYVKMLLNYSV